MTSAINALEIDWERIRTVEPISAALYLDRLMVSLDSIARRGFAMRGMCLMLMEERQLWNQLVDPDTGLPYKSLNSWILRAAPYSHGDCHESLRSIKELHDIPIEDLMQTPRCNIKRLKEMSSTVRRLPSIRKAAQELSEEAFVEKIQADHPDQHLETKIKPTLRLTAAVVDALDEIGRELSIADRQGQLEALCVDFMLERQ